MSSADTSRPLPIQIRPTPGETAESYLRRLARANHLRPGYLRRCLSGPSYYGPIRPVQPAVLPGRPLAALEHALTGLTPRTRQPSASSSSAEQIDKNTTRTELFGAIRYAERVEELSIRALADRFGIHRRTVRQALSTPIPPARKTPVRPSRALGSLHDNIDAMLQADHTISVSYVWERLIDDHDAIVSYGTVRDYVTRQRHIHSTGGASSDKVE